MENLDIFCDTFVEYIVDDIFERDDGKRFDALIHYCIRYDSPIYELYFENTIGQRYDNLLTEISFDDLNGPAEGYFGISAFFRRFPHLKPKNMKEFLKRTKESWTTGTFNPSLSRAERDAAASHAKGVTEELRKRSAKMYSGAPSYNAGPLMNFIYGISQIKFINKVLKHIDTKLESGKAGKGIKDIITKMGFKLGKKLMKSGAKKRRVAISNFEQDLINTLYDVKKLQKGGSKYLAKLIVGAAIDTATSMGSFKNVASLRDVDKLFAALKKGKLEKKTAETILKNLKKASVETASSTVKNIGKDLADMKDKIGIVGQEQSLSIDNNPIKKASNRIALGKWLIQKTLPRIRKKTYYGKRADYSRPALSAPRNR